MIIREAENTDKPDLINIYNSLISIETECIYNANPITEELLNNVFNRFQVLVAEENSIILGFIMYVLGPEPSVGGIFIQPYIENRIRVADKLILELMYIFKNNNFNNFRCKFAVKENSFINSIAFRFTEEKTITNTKYSMYYDINLNTQTIIDFITNNYQD